MKTKRPLFILFVVVLLYLGFRNPFATEEPDPELFLQLGHTSSVPSVAFSPDGTQLASGSYDNTIKLWEVSTGAELRTLSGHTDSILSVAFSPDGTQLASGSSDNTIKVWEVSTGAELRTLSGHTKWVQAVAFSPDGTQLASGSYDNTIKVWEVSTGAELRTLSGHTKWVQAVAFSPDGTQLASGSDDNTIKVWEVSTGAELRTLSGHTKWVQAVAFSPDGTQLASGSSDNAIKLWEVSTGAELRTLSGHTSSILSVAFSPDGTQLASGSSDNAIKVWEVGTGAELRTLSGHTDSILSVAFSPDGTQLASSSYDNTIKVWEVSTGAELRTLSGHTSSILSVAFSPDGTQLASGSDDNTIRLWEVSTGAELRTLSGHASLTLSVIFSPDGTQLASGSYDNTIKVWEVSTGAELRTLSGHTDWVQAVAFSPDGTQLASGSYDNTIKVWEVSTGAELRTLSGHTDSILSVAFSPDGTQLASGSSDNAIKLWEVSTGAELRTLSGHTDSILSVAFSPDGTQLASGSSDNAIKLWEVSTGAEPRTLSGHTNIVRSVVFSPDGTQLASGSDDNAIKLWEVSTGAELRTLSGHTNIVRSVAFSPDGTQLASGSRDNTIKLWEGTRGDILMSMGLLPGNQWLAYRPGKLVYNSSFRPTEGEQYAAIRFKNKTFLVYPLEYYREELKRPFNLLQAFQEPQPDIRPKWIRSLWDRTENKGLWAGGILFVLFTGTGVGYVLRKRADPMEVAKQFFTQAGFQKVKSVTSNLLLLQPKQGQIAGVAMLWQEEEERHEQTGGAGSLSAQILKKRNGLPQEFKLYVFHKDQGPSTETLQSIVLLIDLWISIAVHASTSPSGLRSTRTGSITLSGAKSKGPHVQFPHLKKDSYIRGKLGCETIPLVSSLLEQALANAICEQRLTELEEPYLTRIDPYAESKPINDPNWFYGRDEFLDRLPAVLTQGQHVGVFGLRKVGKTSLMNQLRQRFLTTPTAVMDCQALADAPIYFAEILQQLHLELQNHGITTLPGLPHNADGETFRKHFLALFDLWKKAGNREPFLLIFDEIDKFFPNQEVYNSEQIIAEYVQCFRVLRGLAQTHRCLVTLVIAYRPDVNRLNLLSPAVGENPMFQSFQEEYLGFLTASDSEAMIREIGLWKHIKWDADAAQRVFYYCGGHPLVSRFFASTASERGKRKSIDVVQVEQVARTIHADFRKNQIGNYYQKGVWELLRDDEQQVLTQLCQNRAEGVPEAEVPHTLDNALTNLEHFGLILNQDGKLCVSAQLLRSWVQRQTGQ